LRYNRATAVQASQRLQEEREYMARIIVMRASWIHAGRKHPPDDKDARKEKCSFRPTHRRSDCAAPASNETSDSPASSFESTCPAPPAESS
jgi:hypothetical protein